MENRTNIEKLNDKVSDIIQQYHALRGETELMRTEIMTLKAEREITNQELDKLVEQNAMKDLEIEEIVSKIESILG